MNNLYRPYHFPDGRYSGEGLTQDGLREYLQFLGNRKMSATIIENSECTPQFGKCEFEQIAKDLKKVDEGSSHVIYRQGHTVSMVKDSDAVLLLDSYNAYGAKDADNLPLLRFLREQFPKHALYNLHDSIQRDYHNCAFFATKSASQIMRELDGQGITLRQFINDIDTNKLAVPNPLNIADLQRLGTYTVQGVETIATPSCLAPCVQSMTDIKTITDGSKSFVEEATFREFGSHQRALNKSIITREHKGALKSLNNHIQSINDDFKRRI